VQAQPQSAQFQKPPQQQQNPQNQQPPLQSPHHSQQYAAGQQQPQQQQQPQYQQVPPGSQFQYPQAQPQHAYGSQTVPAGQNVYQQQVPPPQQFPGQAMPSRQQPAQMSQTVQAQFASGGGVANQFQSSIPVAVPVSTQPQHLQQQQQQSFQMGYPQQITQQQQPQVVQQQHHPVAGMPVATAAVPNISSNVPLATVIPVPQQVATKTSSIPVEAPQGSAQAVAVAGPAPKARAIAGGAAANKAGPATGTMSGVKRPLQLTENIMDMMHLAECSRTVLRSEAMLALAASIGGKATGSSPDKKSPNESHFKLTASGAEALSVGVQNHVKSVLDQALFASNFRKEKSSFSAFQRMCKILTVLKAEVALMTPSTTSTATDASEASTTAENTESSTRNTDATAMDVVPADGSTSAAPTKSTITMGKHELSKNWIPFLTNLGMSFGPDLHNILEYDEKLARIHVLDQISVQEAEYSKELKAIQEKEKEITEYKATAGKKSSASTAAPQDGDGMVAMGTKQKNASLSNTTEEELDFNWWDNLVSSFKGTPVATSYDSCFYCPHR
jgi:hypothetical protein